MITGLSAEKGEFTSESGDLMLKDSLLQEVNITSTTGDNYVKNVKRKYEHHFNIWGSITERYDRRKIIIYRNKITGYWRTV